MANGNPTTDRGGVQQAIRALKADGWSLAYVDDGGEEIPVNTEAEALDTVMSVDESHIYVRRGEEKGYAFIVLGNDPTEVVCDYTTNLTALDRLIDRWIENEG